MTVLLVGLVGGAVWMFSRSKADEGPPDTEDTITNWKCEKCGAETKLTARKMDDWMKDDKRIRLGTNSRRIVFKCDPCGTDTLCRALFCRQHNVMFVSEHSDGKDGDCPKCAASSGGG